MTKLSMIFTVVITLLLIKELLATPVKHQKRRMKRQNLPDGFDFVERSMDWCNLNIMGCALYFTHIIPFRLHFDVIKFLVEKGADLNLRDSGNWTVLMYASYIGHLDIVKYLIKEGADPKLREDIAILMALSNKNMHLTVI